MQSIDCPLCWIEAHVGNPDGEEPGHPLKPIKFKKDVKPSKPVYRFRTPEGKHFRDEAAKLDNWLYHKRLTEYFKKDEDEPSNPENPGEFTQPGQILPARQMWLLETMCRRMGVDVKLIDPMIGYWENKEEIEREAHTRLHLKVKKDNHELEALAKQARAMEREEAEDLAEYLRSMA